MALTNRQRNSLHEAIAAYLASQGGAFDDTLAAFKKEAGIEENDLSASIKKKLLEKKWTAVVRLQRKVMELEGKNKRLQEDMETYGSKAKYAKAMARKDYMPRSPAKHILKGHRGVVTCVCFHPNFTVAATSAEDATIKLWDYETGEFERTLKSHINAVNHVDFNEDGSLLASCSADLSIKLWSTKTYSVIRTLTGHDHNVSCVRFAPSGALFSCSRDSSVRFWDPTTGYSTQTLEGHDGWLRDVICSSDGKLVASCSTDQSIMVWKMPSGKRVSRLLDHDHVVESIAFSNAKFDASMKSALAQAEGKTIIDTGRKAEEVGSGARYLVSASRDKTVKVWNVATGACAYTLVGHDNWVRDVVFHPQGQFVISVSDDRSMRVWDVAKGKCVRKITDAHGHFVQCVAAHTKAPIVLTGGVDMCARLWDCR